ncbi:radical SAM protein [Desulfopila sp. IMCC35008]|uniref:radical SAM protein n=1 Tax=Desulfopila sp. IMCC35008 TaxID=2653858 RepID=UPI0013D7CA18|nr:radical SAM protein [Desulfopila sp. IMCC35008]
MSSEEKTIIRGTREWAVANIDCCTGCPHDCRYCYARYDAVVRKRQIPAESWRQCVVRQEDVNRTYPLYDGQVMFPATHDIVPEILDDCITVIARLLQAGNRVLIVTKPHKVCIERVCSEFSSQKKQILFRLTITARNNELLQFWEPGAPGYEERKECLHIAWSRGYETSVSVEPMLDSEDVVDMFHDLAPFVTHSIWIGKMNRIDTRVQVATAEEREQVNRVSAGQDDARIRKIYDRLKMEPLVRWKESIKSVVGLELPREAGLDT